MTLSQIKTDLEAAEKNHTIFKSKGTKAAASRARKHLMQIKKTADVLRKELLAESKAMPVKKRTKKEKPEPKK
jgi:hypothetical protein